MLNDGDEVILPAPWVSYFEIVKLSGRLWCLRL
jgi:aspartate/methionine/tyrosine aminotransferase